MFFSAVGALSASAGCGLGFRGCQKLANVGPPEPVDFATSLFAPSSRSLECKAALIPAVHGPCRQQFPFSNKFEDNLLPTLHAEAPAPTRLAMCLMRGVIAWLVCWALPPARSTHNHQPSICFLLTCYAMLQMSLGQSFPGSMHVALKTSSRLLTFQIQVLC